MYASLVSGQRSTRCTSTGPHGGYRDGPSPFLRPAIGHGARREPSVTPSAQIEKVSGNGCSECSDAAARHITAQSGTSLLRITMEREGRHLAIVGVGNKMACQGSGVGSIRVARPAAS